MSSLFVLAGLAGLFQQPVATAIPVWVWVLVGIILLAIFLGLAIGARSSGGPAPADRQDIRTDDEARTIPATGPVAEEAPPLTRDDSNINVYPDDPTAHGVDSTESVVNTHDLTVIEGIGPNIQQVLNGAGITTFDQLASIDPKRLREIINSSGLPIKNVNTWPEQASLAASGRWDELRALQERLENGKNK
jgi:predicted flap endonuclease-1-like 5' DNA nuclease